MNKKNGFTLVELIAVIVILGVLAIIIVPRINNAIENSRKNSVAVSATQYSKSITNYFLNSESDTSKVSVDMSGSFFVSEGNLTRNGSNYDISFSGEAPTGGRVNLINGEVVSGCLLLDKYFVIIMDSSVVNVGKGDCPKLIPDHIDDEIIYFAPEDIKSNPVYFNPNMAEYCTETEYNSNMSAAADSAYPKTGCLKWYVYSENPDGTINMIMAHNTSATAAWIDTTTNSFPNSDSDYYDGASVGITYDYSLTTGDYIINASGPVTALKQLKTDTDSWSSSLVRSDSYQQTKGNRRYRINYSGYKARLLSAEELASIVNKDWGGYWVFYLGYNYHEVPTFGANETSLYSWLYDYTSNCTRYGCSVSTNDVNDNYTWGYWTSTSNSGGAADTDENESWYISEDGMVTIVLSSNPVHAGIRPVITYEKPENF